VYSKYTVREGEVPLQIPLKGVVDVVVAVVTGEKRKIGRK